MSIEEVNKIKVNRPTLTGQQIVEQENVESILSKHKKLTKRPVYKQRKFYLAVLLVFVVALLMYYADKEERVNEKNKIENSN